MEKDFRAEIGALVQDRKQAYTAMSDRIWGFAEPRFQEYDSSRLQQESLKARGFSIRRIWPERRRRLLPSMAAESRYWHFWASLTPFPAWSRRRTAQNAVRSPARPTAMAAATIFLERRQWQRWTL